MFCGAFFYASSFFVFVGNSLLLKRTQEGRISAQNRESVNGGVKDTVIDRFTLVLEKILKQSGKFVNLETALANLCV